MEICRRRLWAYDKQGVQAMAQAKKEALLII